MELSAAIPDQRPGIESRRRHDVIGLARAGHERRVQQSVKGRDMDGQCRAGIGIALLHEFA